MIAPYKYPTAEHAESVGHSIGQTLVGSLLRSTSQAEALRHLIASIQILFETEHHQESAIGGFSVALVNVLEVGAANLPRISADAVEGF